MTALLVLNYDVVDRDLLEHYRTRATPVLLGPGRGVLLASTPDTEHLPEAPPCGTHTVVLQFDDAGTARSVYESAEYQRLASERLRATRPHSAMIIPVADQPPAG